MPTTTFHNLKAEKRERFLEAAYLEFARHEYAAASISRIVAELGIAKGSLYQYFENKQDLYFYLLETATSSKFAFIREYIERENVESHAIAFDDPATGASVFDYSDLHGDKRDDEDSFFRRHQAIILAGTTFDFRFPRYSLLIIHAMRENEHPDLGKLAEDLTKRSMRFLREYVDLGIERGEIRQDLDPELIAHMVNAMTLTLGPYMEAKYGFSLPEQLEHPERPLPFSEEQLRNEVSAMVEIMRSGLEPKNRS